MNVLQYKRVSRRRLRARSVARPDCHLRIADRAVEERNTTNRQRSRSSGIHIQSCRTVVNRDAIVCPTPIPNLIDSRHSVVEGQISHSKLLIAHVKTVQAAVEDEIVHKATRSRFNENALMLRAIVAAHLEYDILEARCLASRPVDASR